VPAIFPHHWTAQVWKYRPVLETCQTSRHGYPTHQRTTLVVQE